MSNDVSFHRLEAYDTYDTNRRNVDRFRLSFNTRQHGYYYVHCLVDDYYNYQFEEFLDGPELTVFSECNQYYIKCVCVIVSQLVMNGSMPDFEK